MMTVTDSGGTKQSNLVRWLFNPFYYIAGGKALLLGVCVIVLSAVIAMLGNARFDGVLDFHHGGAAEVSLGTALIDGFVSWFSLAVLLFIAGLIFSKSRVRPVDIFGTQALARTPYLLVSFLALWSAPWRYTARLVPGAPQNAEAGGLVPFILVSVVILVMLAWMIWLMYKAFSHSSNLAGAKAAVIFVVCLLAAEALSKTALIAIDPRQTVDITAPRVLETVPADGAVDVDPTLTEIRVKFSKAMRDSCWSWCFEDRSSFPVTDGDSYYSEDYSVAVLPVKLEPSKEYVIWVNKGKSNAFQDRAGNRVPDYRFIFSTK